MIVGEHVDTFAIKRIKKGRTAASGLGSYSPFPTRLEVVLFKRTETRAFLRGTALRFHLVRLNEGLGNLYAFEGLCFPTPEAPIAHWSLRL